MFALDQIKDFLSIVGAVCVVLAPLTRAYARSVVHGALTDAPTMLALTNRVTSTETWQKDHAADVALIPRLAAILDRMESTLSDLNTTLRERVARLEGAES